MSELLEISAALRRAARENQVSVLATVVRTEGSTYRRIGARRSIATRNRARARRTDAQAGLNGGFPSGVTQIC